MDQRVQECNWQFEFGRWPKRGEKSEHNRWKIEVLGKPVLLSFPMVLTLPQ